MTIKQNLEHKKKNNSKKLNDEKKKKKKKGKGHKKKDWYRPNRSHGGVEWSGD